MVVTVLDGLTIMEKQAVLSAVKPQERIELVTKLILKYLAGSKRGSGKEEVEGGPRVIPSVTRQLTRRGGDKRGVDSASSSEGDADEIATMEQRITAAELPPEVSEAADRVLKQLKRLTPQQPDYHVNFQYLDWLASLPWKVSPATDINLREAKSILDQQHSGLEKIKRRIVEYLAVAKLTHHGKVPILVFVGPPGTGKTSLAKSIAQCMGRPFERVSLGGVRDEAELRGHRRTYIGSLPGSIISTMRKAKCTNPVILLDEIDKVGKNNHNGDPSAALLEILDPEQNSTFKDNYLAVPYDLSNVLFIATANSLDTMAAPLLDRMEIITLPSYMISEKINIVKEHVLPKQLMRHGVEAKALTISDEMIEEIITGYTREAGIRLLEKKVATICRHCAVRTVELRSKDGEAGAGAVSGGSGGEANTFHLHISDKSMLVDILGPPMYHLGDKVRVINTPGVVAGLAWTEAGGELLHVEATRMGGKGDLILTGNLGEVMKESANIVKSFIRSHQVMLGIPGDFNFSDFDIHIHFPAGSVPKDGPSAGVAMLTALVSLFTNKIARGDVAMTGELSLTGNVLAIGGVRDKVLAAYLSGKKTVILPYDNKRNIEDVPSQIRDTLEFVFAKTAFDVLKTALPSFDVLPEWEQPQSVPPLMSKL